jgi:nitrate/TMAO reductase-like tetraheme cytochrome c subunit
MAMRIVIPRSAFALVATVAALGGCGGSAAPQLSHDELTDPQTCKTCHPTQYQDWSGSMHAYATDDPVFQAMNQRAQVGTFCVTCHAPMAVRENLTDGTNLAAIAPPMRGITCYFCHSIESVTGTHNDPLVLATDDGLFGPFADPVAGSPHRVGYSRLLDGTTTDSATACGSCHDIQNLQGAHVERTFQEWQATTLSVPPAGESCAECHMVGSPGAVSTTTPTKIRRVHNHGFPAVDLAIGDFPVADPQNDIAPQNTAQQTQAQAFLDTTVQSTLCLNPQTNRLQLTLDNVAAAGHSWPSGATPDRRVWVELTAYQGGTVIYASGNTMPVAGFPSALPLEDASPDPDLWLIRDCLFDGSGKQITLFWEAASIGPSNQLPGLLIQNVNDPSTYQTHMMKEYPDAGRSATLPATPDHVTVQLHLQAIGDDVLASLVASGDLDAAIPPQIARYQIGGGGTLDWTPTSATVFHAPDAATGAVMTCVTSGSYKSNTTLTTSHATCAP